MVKLGDFVKFYSEKKTITGLNTKIINYGKVIALCEEKCIVSKLGTDNSETSYMSVNTIAELKRKKHPYAESEFPTYGLYLNNTEISTLDLLFKFGQTVIDSNGNEGCVVGYSPTAGEYLIDIKTQKGKYSFSFDRDILKKNNFISENFSKSAKLIWARPGALKLLQSSGVGNENKVEQEQEKDTMSGDAISKFVANVKVDAKDAGYRVAANQMSRTTKRLLVRILKDNGVDKKQVKAISDLIDTDLGEATISYVLGLGFTYAPKLKEDPRIKKLAEELRIEGMAGAANIAVDSILAEILPGLHDVLGSLPEVMQEEQVMVEKNVKSL